MFCCLKYYVSTFLNCLNHIVYGLGWLTLAVTILKICLGREGLQKLRNYVYAFMLNNYVSKSQLRIDMNMLRERLFKSLNDLESSKSVLQKKHGLDILEVCNMILCLKGSGIDIASSFDLASCLPRLPY